jgi:flagellar biosynthesis/type III secretory pathway protein FliH
MVLQRLVPGAAIPAVCELKEIESMLAERVVEWTKTWKEQGIEEGRKEGREEGRKEGRKEGEIAILERLLTHRFGLLPEAIQMRLRSATTEQLEYWADQVLDAATIEDVFHE